MLLSFVVNYMSCSGLSRRNIFLLFIYFINLSIDITEPPSFDYNNNKCKTLTLITMEKQPCLHLACEVISLINIDGTGAASLLQAQDAPTHQMDGTFYLIF